MKRLVALIVVVLLAFAAGGAALAARVDLVVSPATVAPGAAVRVIARSSPCHVGGSAVAISAAFPGRAFGAGTLSGRVGRGGAFSIHGHVRSGVHPGRYTVGVRCGGGNLGVTAYLRVR
ncbi:MAG TPA: hypothetical protein VII54_05315 [Gaiellaceae bacterium]